MAGNRLRLYKLNVDAGLGAPRHNTIPVLTPVANLLCNQHPCPGGYSSVGVAILLTVKLRSNRQIRYIDLSC